jgi:hypothetical protein
MLLAMDCSHARSGSILPAPVGATSRDSDLSDPANTGLRRSSITFPSQRPLRRLAPFSNRAWTKVLRFPRNQYFRGMPNPVLFRLMKAVPNSGRSACLILTNPKKPPCLQGGRAPGCLCPTFCRRTWPCAFEDCRLIPFETIPRDSGRTVQPR